MRDAGNEIRGRPSDDLPTQAVEPKKMRYAMNIDKILDDVIEQHRISPIDILGIGDKTGEYNYVKNLRNSYIRTILDIEELFAENRNDKHLLEIGSFLGPVSISLKRIGYNVAASDIPEFYQSQPLRRLYESNQVAFSGLNLRNCKLPYETDSFDAVIICEVLEHLNFNPLPVLMEISRVLKKGGYIYIGMPNQSSLNNRLKLAMGQSIHNPVQDFFQQLDRTDNMIVGLHWREYTLGETIQMIEKMGFETVKKYYYAGNFRQAGFLKSIVRRIIYSYQAFKPFQVVIGRKNITPEYNFWVTEANS